MVGVDLSQAFEVGHDTPRQETSHAPLGIAAAAAHALAEWFHYGSAVSDAAALATAGPQAEPWAIQLWPEHFDAAFDLAKQH